MGLLSNLFGNKTQKLIDLQSRGAVIVDVRTKREYESGAIPGSEHIPLQSLSNNISKIKKWDKPVICVCASGARSASASTILKASGIEAVNGGSWISLAKKLHL